MGWKSNVNVHFLKQMLLFRIFLPFILRYGKKVLKLQNIIATVFHIYYIPLFYQNSF